MRFGEHRAGAHVDAADERNVDTFRQRSRPVRQDDLALHVDARKRIDVPARNRPPVPNVHDRQRSSHRTGERAHHEVFAEAKAATVYLDRRGGRVDLRLAHRVVLKEGAIIASRFEARLLQPRDDEPRRRSKPGDGVLRPFRASDERYSRSRARPSAVMRSAALRTGSGRPADCACNTTPPSNRRTNRRLRHGALTHRRPRPDLLHPRARHLPDAPSRH